MKNQKQKIYQIAWQTVRIITMISKTVFFNYSI